MLVLAALAISAQTKGPGFTVTKIGDGVYAAIGEDGGPAGSNAGFIVGSNGVAVVDTFTGVAAADNGGVADDGSNAGVASIIGSGVGHDNNGNSSTTQQNAVGDGASNQSNTAQVNGSAWTAIQQGNENVAVHFTQLWW